MTRTRVTAVLLAVAACVAGLLSALAAPAAAAPSGALKAACAPAHGRVATCFARYRSEAGLRRAAAAPQVTPADVAAAYRLPANLAPKTTVAIVDAQDNPNAEKDLAVYRKRFGLPACTTANGCFRKVNQNGKAAPLPEGDPGWGLEIALDLDAVSASCPSCKILLVEGDSPSLDDLGVAVNTAVKLGAAVVSNSYGTDEFNGMTSYLKKYYTHPGVAQVASSGDYGFGLPSFPAVSPSLIAAGGTSLTKSTTARGWTEKAWEGAGSGCSGYVAKPAWQQDKNCPTRNVADVSAIADPDSGFLVYDTYGLDEDNGYLAVGGTSLSAPLIAGMIARAGNAASFDSAKPIYQRRASFFDVVGGSNGYCGGDYLCTGVKGYDGPTGIGSPNGLAGL